MGRHEPKWKRLVLSLREREFDSVYLDRLTERLNTYASETSLQKEVADEMAAALRRAEDKVNAALLELSLAERQVSAAPDAEGSREAIRAYNAQRETAKHARWCLIVHRESLGLTNHDDVERLYPLPPKKTEPQ